MRKALISSILGLALMFSITAGALASHYVYTAEDPAQQKDLPGKENYVFFYWGLVANDLWWWAESSILSDVTTAKNNWTASVPELTWLQVSSMSDADVVFRYVNYCPGGAAACTDIRYWSYDSNRDGNYWTDAFVYINPLVSWSASGRIGAIAHEMGHLYGLHERFIENPPSCNNSETTVMDYLTTIGGQVYHCDGLQGPAAIDDSRVTSYWSQGYMSSFSATANGSVGTYTWKDDAWADYRHQPKWFYWNGSAWIEYYSKLRTANVGVHRITEDRTLTEVVDRRTYGAPAGWHIACGDPWFIKFNTAGSWNCSNSIWLN